ncbi:MAG TPA: SOS response-associated peptidase [Gemmataceae bacterium]|jgi:putative SOS response-associated peptidase YedK|nr:SOS response-associated peptidase [Gemmataceae bacterium]
MCGRFTLKTPAAQVKTALGLFDVPELTPRYNIAPTQSILAVRPGTEAKRECVFLRWGLVPSWATDVKIGNQLLNARKETVATKPSFRSAFRRQRCLIPADGFYEWQKLGKAKQPFWIHRPDEMPFFFAGLWDRNENGEKGPLETCTIVTTEANGMIKSIHERMPLILQPKQGDEWLDPQLADAKWLECLAACPDDFLVADRVSDHVNSPRNNDCKCIEPISPNGLFGKT